MAEQPFRLTGAGATDEKGASLYLGPSVRTLRRWRQQGIGPEYVTICGRVWYRLQALERFMDLCNADPLGPDPIAK